jgi:hypothetical protein
MLISAPCAMAQDETGIPTVLKLEYFHVDSVHTITATLRAKQEGRYTPLNGMEITFKFNQGGVEKQIGTGMTNDKGKVAIAIPEDILSGGGDKGIYSFGATFNGKEKYSKISAGTAMKPLKMEMSFFQKDQVKMVELKASEPGNDNQWVPVENLEIEFYVPRTFSLLKVGKATLSNGITSFEFPTTIPGNTLGYLTLLAKVEESEVYGNVEVSGTINWGKHLPPMKAIKRGLGDTDAPLWMVYTLIVLLSLVWFHYMYVIYMVFKIRYLGKL